MQSTQSFRKSPQSPPHGHMQGAFRVQIPQNESVPLYKCKMHKNTLKINGITPRSNPTNPTFYSGYVLGPYGAPNLTIHNHHQINGQNRTLQGHQLRHSQTHGLQSQVTKEVEKVYISYIVYIHLQYAIIFVCAYNIVYKRVHMHLHISTYTSICIHTDKAIFIS